MYIFEALNCPDDDLGRGENRRTLEIFPSPPGHAMDETSGCRFHGLIGQINIVTVKVLMNISSESPLFT
jgi:hypothetical protein